MCGLAGMAGTLERKNVDAFNDLMHFTSLRGRDSTGIAAVDRDLNKDRKDTYLFRALGPAMLAQEYKRYDTLVAQHRVAVIGHCRSATVGKVSVTNAHPFEFDELVGAHNGTLPYQECNLLRDNEKFGTDSEALLFNINQFGVEAVIPEIQGAWALTWYDKVDHSINFLRNAERPLYYALVNDGKAIMWASEFPMLHAACNRRGIECDSNNAYTLPEDAWYKFLIPKQANEAFAEPQITVVEGRPVRKVEPFRGYNANEYRGSPVMQALAEAGMTEEDARDLPFTPGSETTSTGRTTNGSVKAHVRTLDIYRKNKKVGVEHRITGFDGKALLEDQFIKATGQTCSYCDEVHDWSDIVKGDTKIAWIAPNRYVCEDCDNPIMHQFYNTGAKK